MKRLFIMVLILCTTIVVSVVHAAGITNFDKLITPEYWITNNTNGNKVILDVTGIKNFNSSVRALNRTVVDLANYPLSISGDSLKTRIMDYEVLEDPLYLNGKMVSNNYKNILRTQTNINAIPATVTPRYAVVVRRTNVRNLPTGQGLFFYAEDTEFDALQETVMDPGEPVIVQHVSANGWFYYVQCYNYSGWINKMDLAFTDRNTWLQYVNPKQFLVVTAKNLPVQLEKETILYQQGARIAYKESGNNFNIVIPQRNTTDNSLMEITKTFSKSALAKMVHAGYLPYTSNNIIKAVFENYAMPYGWGGLKNSVDCSALIANAYRTVGVILPRNSDEQVQTAGQHYTLEGLDRNTRIDNIRNLMPGSVLYLEGHSLVYLGTSNNIPFVIHSLGSYYPKGVRQRVMRVVVSDLSLNRSNGQDMLQNLLVGVEYK